MNSKVCYDHKGRRFANKEAMCKFWKVDATTFTYRINHGRSLEFALTALSYADIKGKAIEDHEGNKFDSVVKMLDYWGIESPSVYYNRRRSGWTLEEALTGVHITAQDHEGREFNTVRAMTAYWGIDVNAYYGRIRNGWTQEEALTGIRKRKAV